MRCSWVATTPASRTTPTRLRPSSTKRCARLISAAHEEARDIIEPHQDAMERMVKVLLEKETVDAREVAEIFADVPKWEHAFDGSLRIKYPEDPVLPQHREDVAAAVEVEEPEEVTESLKLDRKLPRTKGRPAEA